MADLTIAKQQMVEIAKALSFNSEVLIMDEPTSALSETEIQELFRIIRELRNRGVGVVYISHRIEELKQICDRLTVLRDGRYIDTVDLRDVSVDQSPRSTGTLGCSAFQPMGYTGTIVSDQIEDDRCGAAAPVAGPSVTDPFQSAHIHVHETDGYAP